MTKPLVDGEDPYSATFESQYFLTLTKIVLPSPSTASRNSNHSWLETGALCHGGAGGLEQCSLLIGTTQSVQDTSDAFGHPKRPRLLNVVAERNRRWLDERVGYPVTGAIDALPDLGRAQAGAQIISRLIDLLFQVTGTSDREIDSARRESNDDLPLGLSTVWARPRPKVRAAHSRWLSHGRNRPMKWSRAADIILPRAVEPKSAIIANIADKDARMKRVPATEAKNRLGAILDDAQREPIVIRRQDRDIAVVLSMADYERLRAGNIDAFFELRKQVAAEAAANGLTEERLNELLADDDA